MKSWVKMLAAFLLGLIGGFVLFEVVVRATMRWMEAVPIAFIAALSFLLPLGGAFAAVALTARRERSKKS